MSSSIHLLSGKEHITFTKAKSCQPRDEFSTENINSNIITDQTPSCGKDFEAKIFLIGTYLILAFHNFIHPGSEEPVSRRP